MNRPPLVWTCFLIVLLSYSTAPAREIHVAKTGSDSGVGTPADPYQTIGRAARVAQPGDTVTVHAGTYREWIKPPRGGSSEAQRILYQAAPGEEVVIKGSERVSCWVRQPQGVWKVALPTSFFGDYNPYALSISGGWLNYGQWHHRGDVYLNGQALREKKTVAEVAETKDTWCCRFEDQVTTIWANFGTANPNQELAEINVRECLFMPETTGLK